MNALHRLLDYLAGSAIHIDWYVLAGAMLAGALAAGWVVRRR